MWLLIANMAKYAMAPSLLKVGQSLILAIIKISFVLLARDFEIQTGGMLLFMQSLDASWECHDLLLLEQIYMFVELTKEASFETVSRVLCAMKY